MAFSHHHITSPNEQQFYHNLYANATSSIKDKNDGIYKSQKIDYGNNNSEFTSITMKDGENSKRFSVNNLLKPPTSSPPTEKFNGK
jgi:hypothetical protein